MRSSELLLISTPQVQEYLSANESIDEKKLLLAKKEILGIPSSEMANQVIGRRKAKLKFPSWYQTTSIVYPPSANLEQSSSEATAKFKAELIRSELVHSSLLVDLTGGFGVDTFFLGKLFSEAIHIEPNETLSAIAAHNHRLLGASILHVRQTAEEYLKANTKRADLFLSTLLAEANQKKYLNWPTANLTLPLCKMYYFPFQILS